MPITAIEGTMTSRFVSEDYLPAVADFGNAADYRRHVVFEREDTDTLELCLDPKSGELLRVALILCNHFSESPEPVNAPEATEAIVRFELQKVTDCPEFFMVMHPDGLRIKLCDEPPARYVKAGQVLFGIAEPEAISEVLFVDLTKEDVDHVRNELTC